MSSEEREFESFMARVDKIGYIIEGLASNDQTECEEAMKEATFYLEGKINRSVDEGYCEVKHNRSVINQEAFNSETLDQPTSSKETFMSVMSKDAEERMKAKRQREANANKFSKEADKYVESNDHESALYFYNKAIDEHVHCPRLYAERAKVLLELCLYTRAIEDCEKGIKLNEDLFILKGEHATTEERRKKELFDDEMKSLRNQILATCHAK